MRFDKFTQKAQSALLDAQNLAEGFGHGSVEPEHLLAALLHQEGGVVPAIVAKIGVDQGMLDQAVQRAIAAMPRLSGASSQVGVGRDSSAILQEAQQIASNMKDDYVSTEHLLMAMASSNAGGGKMRMLLARHGLDYNAILQALAAVRGSQRVTSDNPESQYEALTKYGRDLTAEARKGKLDPVIGRDEEIRVLIRLAGREWEDCPVRP